MTKIINRREAVEQGLTSYYTGKPCKRGHIDRRSIPSGNCFQCSREHKKRKRDADPEAQRTLKKAEYERNKETISVQQKKYREDNWEAILERRRNSDTYNQYMQEYLKEYLKQPEQRGKHLARTRKRQLQKRNATPAWYDQEHEQIAELYAEAARLTEETGIPHEVDHTIPLQGESVSGLHCLANLQILTQEENRKKGNSVLVL